MEKTSKRTQKSFAKLVLKQKYESYPQALRQLDLISLKERRIQLNMSFASKGIDNSTLTDLFTMNEKSHKMHTRHENKYKIIHANTNRLKNSSIIFMQNELNKVNKTNKNRKRKILI